MGRVVILGATFRIPQQSRNFARPSFLPPPRLLVFLILLFFLLHLSPSFLTQHHMLITSSYSIDFCVFFIEERRGFALFKITVCARFHRRRVPVCARFLQIYLETKSNSLRCICVSLFFPHTKKKTHKLQSSRLVSLTPFSPDLILNNDVVWAANSKWWKLWCAGRLFVMLFLRVRVQMYKGMKTYFMCCCAVFFIFFDMPRLRCQPSPNITQIS